MNLVQMGGKQLAAGSKESCDVIWKVVPSDSVTILVADITLAAKEVIVRRHRFGPDKQQMFRRATARALDLLSDVFKLAHYWGRDGVAEYIIYRGANRVRPEDVAGILSCKVERTGQRWHRVPDGNGSWFAEPLASTEENLCALKHRRSVLVWDGCSASGSTLVGLIRWMRVNNPQIDNMVIFCPIMGDIAYRRACEAARKFNMKLTIVCLGIYKVLPVGWKGTLETDIVIPADHTAGDLLIPARQKESYESFYQPNHEQDRICCVGDVGSSMDPSEIAQYVAETIKCWPQQCNAPIPQALLSEVSGL